MTRVSAIIPVYNGAATVAQAIESVLAQRFDGEIETVVVNDGSTDSTPQVLERYESKINVLTQPNRGLAAARNAGAALSSGEYLAFLDADDYWLPDHLAKTSVALDRNPRAVLAFCDVEIVDENGQSVQWAAGRAPSMDDLLHIPWRMVPSAVVMRRSVFELCGRFFEEFRCSYEDLYIWLRAREHGEFEYIPKPLVIYRLTPYVSRVDKYEPGRRIFVRLVRERYGRAAEPLISSIASYSAPAFVQKALQQMDSGDWRGALRTWIQLLRLRPTHLLDRRYFRRLLRPQNLKRVTAIFQRIPVRAERS